jgi:hypothetical protein
MEYIPKGKKRIPQEPASRCFGISGAQYPQGTVLRMDGKVQDRVRDVIDWLARMEGGWWSFVVCGDADAATRGVT